MIRTAVITQSPSGDPHIALVRRHLPTNYTATPHVEVVGYSVVASIVITGRDVAGWTLDGYVIPRLASSNVIAKETS